MWRPWWQKMRAPSSILQSESARVALQWADRAKCHGDPSHPSALWLCLSSSRKTISSTWSRPRLYNAGDSYPVPVQPPSICIWKKMKNMLSREALVCMSTQMDLRLAGGHGCGSSPNPGAFPLPPVFLIQFWLPTPPPPTIRRGRHFQRQDWGML